MAGAGSSLYRSQRWSGKCRLVRKDILKTRTDQVQIWNKTIRDGKSVLDHVKRMNHLDPAGFNFHAAITCILPMAQVVYTSDEDGRVVSTLYAYLLKFPADSDGSTNGIAFSEQRNRR